MATMVNLCVCVCVQKVQKLIIVENILLVCTLSHLISS